MHIEDNIEVNSDLSECWRLYIIQHYIRTFDKQLGFTVRHNIILVSPKKYEKTRGRFRGPGPPLFWEIFGWLYRESLKHDRSGPPLRQSVGPHLWKFLDPPLKTCSQSKMIRFSNRKWIKKKLHSFFWHLLMQS